jgi:hypothetical protein
VNLSLEIRLIDMPLRNANGNQISEQTRCQKLFLVLSRVMYASVRSQKVSFSSVIGCCSGGSTGGCSVGVDEDLVEVMLIVACRF